MREMEKSMINSILEYLKVIDKKIMILILIVMALLFANMLVDFGKHIGTGLYYLLNSQ